MEEEERRGGLRPTLSSSRPCANSIWGPEASKFEANYAGRPSISRARTEDGEGGRERATFWQLIMHAQALGQCMGWRRTRTKVDILGLGTEFHL